MTDIIISGRGNMGKVLTLEVPKNRDFCLLGNIDSMENFSDVSEAVIIDFSRRENLPCILNKAIKYKLPLVSGTTGFNEEDLCLLRKASSHIPVFYSPNMSMGVEILRDFLKSKRELLEENYCGQIVEIHRENKKDAPSGTAQSLKDAMWEDVKINSLRFGDFKGTHSVILVSDGEVIEIRHTALKRSLFARGAMNAAKFIKERENGLYSMEDMV